jgi:carbon storage regulator CsrA
MLVLSRKKNQQILFPNLGIEVVIQRIAGNSVSLGINAPKSVQILRGELADDAALNLDGETPLQVDPELLHALRNQLNNAQLTIALAQKQLRLGKDADAEATLNEMICRLTEIDRQITSSRPELTTPAADTSPQAVPNAALKSGQKPDMAAKRALVVEDDPNERALLAGYLRLCGFNTSEAADGIEALDFLSVHQVDLVILDMRMPRMNGKETVEAIRSCPRLRKTKIVVVSGEDRDAGLVAEDPRGITEWFSKPLDPERLVGCIDVSRN